MSTERAFQIQRRAETRGFIATVLWHHVDSEPPPPRDETNLDAWYLARLTERLGDVGACYHRGHRDITDDVQLLVSTGLAWLERAERERQR